MASPHERDELRVVMSYIESGWSVGKAVTQQAKRASNKKHIRTSCSADLMTGLEGIMEDFQRQSDEFKEKGGRPFFRCVGSINRRIVSGISCASPTNYWFFSLHPDGPMFVSPHSLLVVLQTLCEFYFSVRAVHERNISN